MSNMFSVSLSGSTLRKGKPIKMIITIAYKVQVGIARDQTKSFGERNAFDFHRQSGT